MKDDTQFPLISNIILTCFILIYPEAGRKSLWLYSLQSLQTSVKGRFQWSDRHHHRCALTLLAGGRRKSNASSERFETTVSITMMMLFEVSEHSFRLIFSDKINCILQNVYKSDSFPFLHFQWKLCHRILKPWGYVI